MVDEEFELRMRDLEEKRQALLQGPPQQQNALQAHAPRNVLEEIMLEANGLSQEDMEKIAKMVSFQDAERQVDTLLMNYIKREFSQKYAQTEEGMKAYEHYLSVLKQSKVELKDINEQERLEFEEFRKLKREGRL